MQRCIAESNTPPLRTGIDDITGLLKQGKPSLCWSYPKFLAKKLYPNMLYF
jgi:hypothetical protein